MLSDKDLLEMIHDYKEYYSDFSNYMSKYNINDLDLVNMFHRLRKEERFININEYEETALMQGILQHIADMTEDTSFEAGPERIETFYSDTNHFYGFIDNFLDDDEKENILTAIEDYKIPTKAFSRLRYAVNDTYNYEYFTTDENGNTLKNIVHVKIKWIKSNGISPYIGQFDIYLNGHKIYSLGEEREKLNKWKRFVNKEAQQKNKNYIQSYINKDTGEIRNVFQSKNGSTTIRDISGRFTRSI